VTTAALNWRHGLGTLLAGASLTLLLLSWVVLPSAASAQPQLPRVSLVLTRTGTVSPINDSLIPRPAS